MEKTYFDYDKDGKKIINGTKYIPDLIRDKETGKVKIGYYGISNMGKFLMISGEIKELLKYSDGENILKDIYEKNVNEQLKKDYKKTFYNNQEFSQDITIAKFKEVKELLTLPTNILKTEDIEKDFFNNTLKAKYKVYIYDTRIAEEKYLLNYKVKNNLLTPEEKEKFPLEVKEATKDSYIFEKIIDYAQNNFKIKTPQDLYDIVYNNNFSSLIKQFNNDYLKEKVLFKELEINFEYSEKKLGFPENTTFKGEEAYNFIKKLMEEDKKQDKISKTYLEIKYQDYDTDKIKIELGSLQFGGKEKVSDGLEYRLKLYPRGLIKHTDISAPMYHTTSEEIVKSATVTLNHIDKIMVKFREQERILEKIEKSNVMKKTNTKETTKEKQIRSRGRSKGQER